MVKRAKIRALVMVTTIAGISALSQYSGGSIGDSTITRSGKAGASTLQREVDTLLQATQSINYGRMEAFENVANDANSGKLNEQTGEYHLLQSLHGRGFSDFQVRTLEMMEAESEASHLAMWSVSRNLSNGDRELVIGRIHTQLQKQADGKWKEADSSWTLSPF